jgi:hypothetical protein
MISAISPKVIYMTDTKFNLITKKLDLKKKISTIEWDLNNLKDEPIKAVKVKLLNKFKKELEEIEKDICLSELKE